MQRIPKSRFHFVLAVIVAAALSASSLLAQPAPADQLFDEAKKLAAAEATEADARKKFDEAATLYRAHGNADKAIEAELEHGRLLRRIGFREMEAKRFDEAVSYFDLAFDRFVLASSNGDLALVCHDLGYIADQKKMYDKAVEFYMIAYKNYLIAGDKSGAGTVQRNVGVLRFNEKKYSEAEGFLETALALRTETKEFAGQALVHIDLGDLKLATQKPDEALSRFKEGLRLYRYAENKKGEAEALSRLSMMPSATVKVIDQIGYLEAALKIYENEKDYSNEAWALWSLGRAHMIIRRPRDAEPLLNRAVDTYMILEDKSREANVAIDLASNYEALGRYFEARTAIERALTILRDVKERESEAFALLIYAEIHSFLNEHEKAREKIEAARKIFKEVGSRVGDVRLNRALAFHYYSLSNYGESIRYALEGLKGAEAEGDAETMASAYIDIGNAYSQLGQEPKAIEYTSKALAIARQKRNRMTESICLSNMGYAYYRMGDLDRAQFHLVSAIAIMRADRFELEEGYATHNLGLVYYKRGDLESALANYHRALPLYQKAGDRRPESFLHDSYGEVYRDRGEYEKAIESFQRSIVLAREIKYSEVEANALAHMMTLWEQRKQPKLAILYGKQAVNVYQSIRATNKGVDKASQKSLVQTNEKTYRQLANILIEDGRLPEAQQVLDLLKAEEYFDFVRRDSSDADNQATLALTESEKKALEEYAKVSASLTALGAQFQTLQDKRNKNGGKLPEAEEAVYTQLKAQVEAAGEGMRTFFAKLANEFSKKVEDGTVVTPQSIETLKADLRRAGNDVVLVSTYLLPERYRAIVTTGRTMVDRKVEYAALKMNGADINRKIFEFQRALQNPRVDPRPLGKELYDIFVKPLEEDLRGAGAKTILWSLDGSLRYVPMAALSPDGKTYLAEKYQNVVVTLGRQTNLFVRPSGDEWRAIGAGVSKQHAGFSALPSVPEEIGSIVHDEKKSTGVLDGTRMLDEQFNLESLRATVPQQTADGKPFNVLHLATHFSLGANDQDSALLLGDGTRLSLFEIGRDEALDFKDVELLTLSACQTGVSTGDANGREVESLGMLAQKKGAKAVLATLWKVADESTSLFMAEFYRIKKANPAMNKAEAIRLAQKEMIDGRLKASGKSTRCRSDDFISGSTQTEFKCDPNAPFSHPYFWSPFVLIGNWR